MVLSEYEKKRKQNRDFFDSLLLNNKNIDAKRESGSVVIHAVALVVVSACCHDQQGAVAAGEIGVVLSTSHVCNRIEWANHVAQLNQEGPKSFPPYYHMSDDELFVKLCALLDPFMELDKVKSMNQWGKEPIVSTENCPAALLSIEMVCWGWLGQHTWTSG